MPPHPPEPIVMVMLALILEPCVLKLSFPIPYNREQVLTFSSWRFWTGILSWLKHLLGPCWYWEICALVFLNQMQQLTHTRLNKLVLSVVEDETAHQPHWTLSIWTKLQSSSEWRPDPESWFSSLKPTFPNYAPFQPEAVTEKNTIQCPFSPPPPLDFLNVPSVL